MKVDLNAFKEELFNILMKCSELYFEHYIYPYNIIISLKGEKPVEPLLEIEKAIAHLMQSLKDIYSKDYKSRAFTNIRKFEGHIERMLLDLYKLAFLIIIKEIENILSIIVLDFGQTANSKKVIEVLLEVKELFKEARNFEMQNLGSSADDGKKEILNIYKRNLEKAYKKLQDLKNICK